MGLDKFKDITLTRGQSRDVLRCRLPELPDRLALAHERWLASGYRDGDTSSPSQPHDGNKLQRLHWAVLGLCRHPRPPEWPKLSDHEWDLVAYGAAIATLLWDEGYDDLTEQQRAGHELFDWLMQTTWKQREEVDRKAQGFAGAGASPATSEPEQP